MVPETWQREQRILAFVLVYTLTAAVWWRCFDNRVAGGLFCRFPTR